MKSLVSLIVLCIAFIFPLSAEDVAIFFDDSYVHEIRLAFDDSDWFENLYESHANDSEDPYFPASFSCDGVSIDLIGVRMKGNSSFTGSTYKKSFKIDFDEYDEDNDDLSFLGIKKLNLNNAYKDPTMMREKIILDFASQFIPTIRTVFVRLYINDNYWGLYTAVEQVDKNFIQDRFGSSEDGNLYKGAASDDLSGAFSDFGSDLAWEGSEESSYYDHYQLKTNESENDYSGLVSMLDVLNNSDPSEFSETLEPLMDVDNVLAGLAINSLFSNHDSYNGSAHNFYIYQSDSTNQFSHILWDTNEAFGSFSMFTMGLEMEEIPLFWLPTGEERPLMEKLWGNDSYAKKYLQYHALMLNQGFDVDSMTATIEKWADLIREDVYADTLKEYSNDAFESNLYQDYSTGGRPGESGILGLQSFVEKRAEYVSSFLSSYADQGDLLINEIVVQNNSSFVDEEGDSDSWIEIYNNGLTDISLSGLYLSDDSDDTSKWACPEVSIESGEYVVLWLDSEASEGEMHVSFTLSESGGSISLYNSSGAEIDSIQYPALAENYSYQRYPDASETLLYSDHSTPEAENQKSDNPSVSLYINEILAENDETLQDPDGTGFPDWFEIYNPNDFSVDLSGMYLTDDSSDPKQWEVPEGLEIQAKGYLLIWADNDEEQGINHANFKLSSKGEEVALYDTDSNGNVLIDLLVFDEQESDISYGRRFDGSAEFSFFETPTPGASNGSIDSFLAYDIIEQDGRYLIYTDWLGWADITYEPNVWSYGYSAWFYLSEDHLEANGIWGFVYQDSVDAGSDFGENTYLNYPIDEKNGSFLIDTGSWLSWLDVSRSPWVWSYAMNTWIYLDEGYLLENGAWVWFSI